MKILKLKKILVGPSGIVLRITYKNLYKTKERDVVKKYDSKIWFFADTNQAIFHEILDVFSDSNEFQYNLNK